MQRRAAAIYFAIFVLVGAGAFAFIQVGMTKPTVDLDGPTYTEEDPFQVGDRSYTVATLEAEPSGGGGGGHGGGGGAAITRSGELTYTNETGANQTITFEDGANVTLNEQPHFVHFEDNSTVQILPADRYAEYQGELADIHNWENRKTGLWAIVFLSFIAGGVLFMSALMPVKG
ncbi:hypothetical protein ACKVMT_08905 [Halobacteriales archaeon Cl-PHB]